MKIPVLDHGYVEFIEAWGTGRDGVEHGFNRPIDVTSKAPFMRKNDHEVSIIEAARQSTQGSFRGWGKQPCDCGKAERIELNTHVVPGTPKIYLEECLEDCASLQRTDEQLLAYLYNNEHSTPFEFSGMTIEVQAPIFVFREWQRHRTQSYNEMSARYASLPGYYYNPAYEKTVDRGLLASVLSNKQAGTDTTPKATYPDDVATWLAHLNQHYEAAESLYQMALAAGVPRELARISMPVGHYSRMRASANLRNWLAFLTLRLDPKAQWEIRQFASIVSDIIAQHFPRTHKLFVDRDQRDA